MDIELYYEEKGAGEPLILLHGNGESMEFFEHQIPFFSQYYRVIAIDTRGQGKSPRGISPYTLRQFAEDLHDFMIGHNTGPAHILGFSDGGNIALEFVLNYPEMVKTLILNGANLFPEGLKEEILGSIHKDYERALKRSGRSARAGHEAELLALMIDEPRINPAELKKLTCRTLVIAGRDDDIIESHTVLIRDSIPGAELSILPGGHYVANENPGRFNQRVLRFLKEE